MFQYIASQLHTFLESVGLQGKNMPLGFTFGFPCQKKAINSATLVSWAKGFNCTNYEGKDIVQTLNAAITMLGSGVKSLL